MQMKRIVLCRIPIIILRPSITLLYDCKKIIYLPVCRVIVSSSAMYFSYNFLSRTTICRSTLYRTTLCTCLSYNSLPVFHALSCLCATSLYFCMSCQELSVFYVLCAVCLPALWWFIRHNKNSFIYEYHTTS